MNSEIRINIVTEGQTEETFVNTLLIDHLQQFHIFDVRAHSITTGYSNGRPHRGGFLRYDHLKNDVIRWLQQDPKSYVTTMVDLYALPSNFPNKEQFIHNTDPYKKVERAEEELAKDINNPRFIPNIQLHEFEAILFSKVEQIHQSMIASGSTTSELHKLQSVRAAFETPEDINDNPQTAPSKRIRKIYPSFQKPTDGIIIAKNIGISTIRRECAHFDKWLKKLESLSQ
jgi:hypothetical protein